MGKTTVGAVYCVYEDSGFLAESVGRIYPIVDAVLMLVGHEPWRGRGNTGTQIGTLCAIANIPDPDKKIHTVWGHWKDEADQRNFGLKYLHNAGLAEWCFIIDDDEMYRRDQLRWVVDNLAPLGQQAYLVPHQTYWKRRDLFVEGHSMALPAFAMTKPGVVYFNENRMIRVAGTWITFEMDQVTCHHLSYIRTDEKMLNKITYFSHASSILPGWYDNVWLGWKEGMRNLHPTQAEAYPEAVSVEKAKHRLEPWP